MVLFWKVLRPSATSKSTSLMRGESTLEYLEKAIKSKALAEYFMWLDSPIRSNLTFFALTKKLGLGLPYPVGSRSSSSRAKLRISPLVSSAISHSVSGQKSLLGRSFKYSFAACLKASKLSSVMLTPAACACPPNAVKYDACAVNKSKMLTDGTLLAEPFNSSPLLANKTVGRLNSSTSLAAAIPSIPGSQLSLLRIIILTLLKSTPRSISFASDTAISHSS